MAAGPVGACWASGSWIETSWTADVWGALGAALAFVLDVNTRMLVYLRDLYGVSDGDLATLSQRYYASQTGEMTARVQKLIADATAATE